MYKLTDTYNVILVEKVDSTNFENKNISKSNTGYSYFPDTGEFLIHSKVNGVYLNLGTYEDFQKSDGTNPTDVDNAKEYLNGLFEYGEVEPPSYDDLTLWANSTEDNEIVDNIADYKLPLGGSSVIDMSAGDNYIQTTGGYTSSPYIYFRGCCGSGNGWLINRRDNTSVNCEYQLRIFSGTIGFFIFNNGTSTNSGITTPISDGDRFEVEGYYDKVNSLLVFRTNINNSGWTEQTLSTVVDIIDTATYTVIGKTGWDALYYYEGEIEELILKDCATDTELVHLTGRGGGSYVFNEVTGEPLLINGTTTDVWQLSTDQTPYNYQEGFSLMSNGSGTYRAPFKTDGTVIYAVDDVDDQGYTCISVHDGVSGTTTHNYSENTIIPPFVQSWYDIPINGTYNDLFYEFDGTPKEIDPSDFDFDYNDAGYLFADVSDSTKIGEILMYLTEKSGTDWNDISDYLNMTQFALEGSDGYVYDSETSEYMLVEADYKI